MTQRWICRRHHIKALQWHLNHSPEATDTKVGCSTCVVYIFWSFVTVVSYGCRYLILYMAFSWNYVFIVLKILPLSIIIGKQGGKGNILTIRHIELPLLSLPPPFNLHARPVAASSISLLWQHYVTCINQNYSPCIVPHVVHCIPLRQITFLRILFSNICIIRFPRIKGPCSASNQVSKILMSLSFSVCMYVYIYWHVY